MPSTPSKKLKVLVLVERLDRDKLPHRTSALVEALTDVTDPAVVAESYRADSRSLKRLSLHYETYGFPAETYDDDVRAFSYKLRDRFAPDGVISYGWDNAPLVYELFRRRLPVVMFLETAPVDPKAVEALKWSSQFAEAVFFTEDVRGHLTFPLSRKFQEMKRDDEPRSRWLVLTGGVRSRSGATQRSVAARMTKVLQDTLQRLAGLAAQSPLDAAAIRGSGRFNAQLFSEPDETSDEDQVERYLFDSGRCIPREQNLAGRLLRRPVEGFNPLVYATENAAFDEGSGQDPLAHFVRAGCPDGTWTHQIIRERPVGNNEFRLRAALHIHMHYPELLPDLLARIEGNETRPNLFLTTTSDDGRDELETHLRKDWDAASRIKVYPLNRGRDIWPFVDLLAAGTFEDYDVVGHLHGKRSPANSRGGDWRLFLWRHLVGGPERIMDAVMSHFQADARLGLVIPEDPHLESWGDNLDVATVLATKMGLTLPLPRHFDFPQGTMFWARPQALAPLLRLDLTPEIMPAEPLADDGTILHAIERLIPFAVADAGFRAAATYVPNSTW